MWRDKRKEWRLGGFSPDLTERNDMPRLTVKVHMTNPLIWEWRRKPYVSELVGSIDKHPVDLGRRQAGFTMGGLVAYVERSTGGGLGARTERSHTKRHYALKLGFLGVDATIKLSTPIWEDGRKETLYARDLWVRKNALLDEMLRSVGCTHDRRDSPHDSQTNKPHHEVPMTVDGEVVIRRFTGMFTCWDCRSTTGPCRRFYFSEEVMKYLNQRLEEPVSPAPTNIFTHVMRDPREDKTMYDTENSNA